MLTVHLCGITQDTHFSCQPTAADHGANNIGLLATLDWQEPFWNMHTPFAALTQGLGNSTHVQESKAEGKVARIEYDRTKVTPGIVHFGVGGFHRGHQAVAIHRLLQQGLAMDWGICGVGVLEGDMKMRDVLDAQDGVFTVVEKSPDGSQTVQLIGSIVEYLYAPDSTEDVLARLADPATRIVSLTITEGGRVAD